MSSGRGGTRVRGRAGGEMRAQKGGRASLRPEYEVAVAVAHPALLHRVCRGSSNGPSRSARVDRSLRPARREEQAGGGQNRKH